MLPEPTALQFGEFTLNPSQRQLYRLEERLSLPVKVFDLLLYLVQNPGRPLLKNELLSSVWPDSFVEESNLSQTVFLLRKALGPAGEGFIQTLPGRGYQFTARVAISVELTRRELAIQDPVAPVPQAIHLIATKTRVVIEERTEERVSIWRSSVAICMGVVAVLALGVAVWLGWQRWEDRVGGPPVRVVVAASDGTTGDPALDRTLAALMRIELGQSPFVSLVPDDTVQAKLLQMEQKPDARLALPLAREVCERTGSQAVIHGSVARAGADYLLTEEALNCLDGTTLGTSSRSIDKPQNLPHALSSMAADLRHSLGESRRTIARFASPLEPATTDSLEALKLFTEARGLINQGHSGEANVLLRKATELDPEFASAWLYLGILAYNDSDRGKGAVYLQKAYELRQHATEPFRLFIVALYNSEVTGDVYEGIRNYQSWTVLYPSAPQPWSGLSLAYRELGDNLAQLAAAQKSYERVPTLYTAQEELIDALIRNQDFVAARVQCDAVRAQGLDGDLLRERMLWLGYLQHDPAYIAQQEAWGRDHGNSPFLLASEAYFAIARGRTKESSRLLVQMRETMEHNGDQEVETSVIASQASFLARLGELREAQRLLASVQASASNYQYLSAALDAGQSGTVESLLSAELREQPHSTLWNEWYGPLVRGNLLLRAHKPQEALAALATTSRFDGKDFDAIYARGLAFVAAKDLPQAEAEFAKIVAHPERNPPSPAIPLAQVQLARVLATEGKSQQARDAYRIFLAAWDHADDRQPLLLQVRNELQALPK